MRARVIGVDLDNTIICYDHIMHERAVELGWIPIETPVRKQAVREQLRRNAGGQHQWEQLQAYVYGEGLMRATLFDGVLEFLSTCARHDVQTYIVSHKSQYAAADQQRIDLRRCAMDWLTHVGVLTRDTYGLDASRVVFEATREAKIAHIETLGCVRFIDDLVEVFEHPQFPQSTERVLFDPHHEHHDATNYKVFHSWSAITQHCFAHD